MKKLSISPSERDCLKGCSYLPWIHSTDSTDWHHLPSPSLSPVEWSRCLQNLLCFICKQLNCSTRNHPQEETTTCPAHQEPICPAHNPERTRVTTTTPATTTTTTNAPTELDLGKYVRELEGRGWKPTELLCLLQLYSCGSKWKRQSIFLEQEVITTSPSLVIVSVLVANKSKRAIHFPIHLQYGARTIVTDATS